jgi:hypothetical protein
MTRLLAGLVWSKWNEMAAPAGPLHLAQFLPPSLEQRTPSRSPIIIRSGWAGSIAMSPHISWGVPPMGFHVTPLSRLTLSPPWAAKMTFASVGWNAGVQPVLDRNCSALIMSHVWPPSCDRNAQLMSELIIISLGSAGL